MQQIKKKVLNLLGLGIAVLGCTTVVAEQGDFWAGLDVLQTNYKMKDGYGANVFGKNPVSTNLFVGYDLPRNFYLEGGYESHKSKKSSVRLDGSESLPGNVSTITELGFLNNIDVTSKFNVEHPYLAIGIRPSFLYYKNVSVQVLAGISLSEIKAQYSIIAENNGNTFESINRFFTKRKAIPLIKAGLNYQLSENIAMRLNWSWYNTSRFKISEDNGSPIEIRAKNSFSTGLGLNYLF